MVITTTHAHNVVSFFIFFQELSKKIKELRPKMTKMAEVRSRYEGLKLRGIIIVGDKSKYK